MKHGTITCQCGQQFYFETNNNQIACINCKKVYDITTYPEKNEKAITEEGEPDGVDV